MKNNPLAVGILGGIAIGTILGILFAPAKGIATRKVIGDKSTDFKNIIQNFPRKISDKMTQTMSNLKNESQQVMGSTKVIPQEDKVNLNNLKDINKAAM